MSDFFFLPTFPLSRLVWDFSGGPVVKNRLVMQGYAGSISGPGTKPTCCGAAEMTGGGGVGGG